MTPLKKRMKEELVLKGYSDQTIDIYLLQVARLARHFNRSPDGLDDEQLRAYVLHLHERGLVLDLEPVTGVILGAPSIARPEPASIANAEQCSALRIAGSIAPCCWVLGAGTARRAWRRF